MYSFGKIKLGQKPFFFKPAEGVFARPAFLPLEFRAARSLARAMIYKFD